MFPSTYQLPRVVSSQSKSGKNKCYHYTGPIESYSMTGPCLVIDNHRFLYRYYYKEILYYLPQTSI